jgi:hypothetical protein
MLSMMQAVNKSFNKKLNHKVNVKMGSTFFLHSTHGVSSLSLLAAGQQHHQTQPGA